MSSSKVDNHLKPLTLRRRIELTYQYYGWRTLLLRVLTWPLRFTPLRGRVHVQGRSSADSYRRAVAWYREYGEPVDIVIPSYNDSELVVRLVASIHRTVPAGMARVFVADDASSPEELAGLQAIVGIEVVRGGENAGFAANVNRGLRATDPARDVVVLNSDTEARDGWLACLQFASQQGEDIGIVGAKLLYPDARIQFAGSVRNLGAPEWFDHRYRFKPEDWGPAAITGSVLAVTGACMYVRRETIERIGLLDEAYPMAYEDVDWCLRAWQAGLRVMYFPAASLYHHESLTRGTDVGERERTSQRVFWERWGDFFDARNVYADGGEAGVGGGVAGVEGGEAGVGGGVAGMDGGEPGVEGGEAGVGGGEAGVDGGEPGVAGREGGQGGGNERVVNGLGGSRVAARRPLRVVYVTEGTGVGGGHRDIFEHLNRLQERGHEVALYTLGEQPDWFELNTPVHTFVDYDELVAALADVDAIKVATWWNTAAPVWLASVLHGIPVYFVQDIETSYYPDDEVVRHAVIDSYRPEFRYMTISGWNRERLEELGLQAQLIPPGIDLENFRPRREVARREDMVLALGRSNPLKNLPLTVDAWRSLPTPRPQLCLFGIEPELVGGAGGMQDEGMRYVDSPSDEQVAQLLSEATVLVQTSTHEGFCLPPLECMATGGAVVCTDAHGNRDFCRDGENCLMPAAEVQAVAAALGRVLDDAQLRTQLGEEGMRTAQEYAWEKRIDALEEFLWEVARPRRIAASTEVVPGASRRE
jgi:GT2 family glycosyltransferase/glycosyltransferase involved in cell wall biosynthesis